MIDQLIGFINQEGWDLSPLQIADMLWFVQQFPTTKPQEPPDTKPEEQDQQDNQDTLSSSPINKPSLPEYPVTLPQASSSVQSHEPDTPSTPDLPIKLPDTGILRNAIELGRKFRPLKVKVDSPRAKVLDIAKTVRKSAELSVPNFPIYFPVTTPKKECWLEMSLLIEESHSMVIWQSLLPEIQVFLSHLGIFRDIKSYRIHWNQTSENLDLYPLQGNSPTILVNQLVNPNRRQLILILSDCISPAWYQRKFLDILEDWTVKGRLTVLNPFPESLWGRTALGYGIFLRLKNAYPDKPVKEWEPIPLLPWKVSDIDPKNSIILPILSLEPESIEAWVNVVIGKGKSLCAGVCLEKDVLAEEQTEEEEELSPSGQINDFYATSSPYAWQLMQYLSAIPINLSTIRLVQQTLVPASTQVHVAEVVMGGLLKPKAPLETYQHSHQVQFEFKPNIREELLKRLGDKSFSRSVIRQLSDKLAERFDYSLSEFEAKLLENPLSLANYEDLDLIQAFATVTIQTLNQENGKYADFVRQLERSRVKVELAQSGVEDKHGLSWIDFLETIAHNYTLTDLETEVLITLFPSPKHLRSISEAAQHLNIAYSTFSSRLSRIYRKLQLVSTEQKRYKLPSLHQLLLTQYHNGLTDHPTIVKASEIEKNLEKLAFETVFVNKKGETIRTEQCEAYYYEESLGERIEPLRMIAIPEGTFMMGSPEDEKDRFDSESPQHQVTVSAFYMSQTPITQAQWSFVASLPQEGKHLEPKPSRFKGDDRPVENVRWQDAIEFCARLSRYTDRNYRLPSEAEWEYACRAGSTTPFHFGETITSKLANYNASYTYQQETAGEYRQETTPVKSFPPNAFGLYDMHGNVWEWCLDPWYNNYKGAPKDGSVWDKKNNNDNRYQNTLDSINVLIKDQRTYVLRGGSLIDDPRNCRSAFRFGYDLFNYVVGFRVACPPG